MRDRLSREEDDIVAAYRRRRDSNTRNRSSGRGDSLIFVLPEGQRAETPFRWRGTPMTGTMAEASGGRGRGILASPRIGRGASFLRSPASVIWRQNLSPMIGSGRGSSVLPAWYPRKPLGDITAVVRREDERAVEKPKAC